MKDKFYLYSYTENIKPLMTKEQYEKFQNGMYFDLMAIALISAILTNLIWGVK